MAQCKPNGIQPLCLLNDEPIRNLNRDGLGLGNWAKVIAGAALGTPGPFTIGVFGKWGEGKTSVLKLSQMMVEGSHMAQKGAITTVSFNAWQYEKEKTPLIPLIAAIINRLETTKKGGKLQKGAVSLIKALRSLIFGLSMKMTAKAPLVGDVNFTLDNSKIVDRYEKLCSQWIDSRADESLYYNAFKVLENLQTKPLEVPKVVVFIDDLDRCFPDSALRLLESIKLVLAQPGFIFVLGVDKRILESYLDRRYKEEFGMEDYHQGPSYLAKIIQLPLWIPPHKERFQKLLDKLLEEPPLAGKKNIFKPLGEIIGFACDHNPRQLVRFINDILVDREVYCSFRPEGEFPYSAFIVSRGLRHQSEYIYQELIKNRELCQKLKNEESAPALKKVVDSLIKKEENQESREALVLRSLRAMDSILRLFVSEPGRMWLAERETRENAHNFLHGRVLDKWVHEKVSKAETRLYSSDEGEIVAGLHTLFALGPIAYPRSWAGRLWELTGSKNKNIADMAGEVIKRVLESASLNQ